MFKLIRNSEFKALQTEIARLKEVKESKPPQELPPSINERLLDVELKLAKLWKLLIDTTPTGQDKLNKFGRKFGGRAAVMLNRSIPTPDRQ